jgi:protein-disulfide isomerase
MPNRPLLTLLAGVAGLALLAGCAGRSGSAEPAAAPGAPAASSAAAGPDIPLQRVTGTYPVTVDEAGATILAGQPGAPSTVDVYEDFLCPFCGQFERANAGNLEKALEAGQVKIRYHILNLLDTHTDPPGYSALAANAALLVAKAQPSAFPAFHASLYASQPSEGDAGYTVPQLAGLAHRAGLADTSALSLQLAAQPYTKQVTANLQAAEKDPKLQQSFGGGQTGFGTPTVLVNGKLADLSDSNWLTATR